MLDVLTELRGVLVAARPRERLASMLATWTLIPLPSA